MRTPADGCPAPALAPDAYTRWRGSALAAVTDRLERRLILDLLGNAEGQRILDVGCGDGMLAVDLAGRGAKVVGIDLSAAMIAAARERVRGECGDATFAVAAARQLPFASASFDAITAITILCFVADAAPVFQEIARVMRPGGRLVIGELGRWSSWAATRRLRAWLGSRLWQAARFRTAGELCALAEGAGLRVERQRGAIYYPRCGIAARLLAPWDETMGRLTSFGAAFLALAAVKPKE
jgi:ubiquinone/menaquinone biosynthesis C-methylase UbiE